MDALIVPHETSAPAFIDVQPPLGQILLARGAISESDVAKAMSFQSSFGGLIGAILIRIGAVSEDAVLEALSTQLEMGIMSNAAMPQDPTTYVTTLKASGIDTEWWVDQAALAWQDEQGVIHCISRDPLRPSLQEALLSAFLGKEIRWWLIRNRELDMMIDLVRRAVATDGRDVEDDVALLW